MFRGLRWRLALWFVCVTGLLYLAFTVLGMSWFYAGLNASLDSELKALAAEIAPEIDISSGRPKFAKPADEVETKVSRPAAVLQLFDENGVLVEEIGPVGLRELFQDTKEAQMGTLSSRVLSTPLEKKGKVVGYMQVQLPTRHRDQAVQHYGLVRLSIMPMLLLCLGIGGYYFARTATRPIEESFRTLRRFMADVGHELKTPISIIQVNAESLEPELEEKGVPLDQLKVITRSTERMGNLVADLMTLVNMEQPQVSLSPVPVELDKAVRASLEEYEELYRAKGVDLNVGSVEPTTVLGENESFKRMVSNLLQNGLRYTDSGGTVTVSLERKGKKAVLKVEDTGIGIDPESLPHIFDRFYRVDKAISRAHGGSGLGLSIVKAIVMAADGKIEVDSASEAGTRFTITLPVLSEKWIVVRGFSAADHFGEEKPE